MLRWLWRGILLGLLLVALWLFTPAQIALPYESQRPALPNGCEAVSLAMVGKYYGVDTNGSRVAREDLAKGPIGSTDPHEAYIGDPFGMGYYSYPEVVAAAANKMFADAGQSVRASAPPFMTIFQIAYQLHQGRPVISWITVDGEWPRRQDNVQWTLPNGERYRPYENLHVVAIDGIVGAQLHLSDPQHGERWIGLGDFIKMHLGMGMKAVVFQP